MPFGQHHWIRRLSHPWVEALQPEFRGADTQVSHLDPGISSLSIESLLKRFRADTRLVAPNARNLAAAIENPRCTARRVLDAAGVDKAALAAQLGPSPPQAQSVFASNRGTRFEADVKADTYAVLVDLLRREGFRVGTVRVLPLRDLYPINPRHPEVALLARATVTRDAILDMVGGVVTAPNLIDGGAIRWNFGGVTARLETDGIAWRMGSQIHVVEIKSFPIVDGRGDPEKVGAAAWQASVYVAAIADLLTAAGLDSGLVATDVLLVCPRNTSLVPTIVRVDVARQVRALRRLLVGRMDVEEVLAGAGTDATLDTTGLDAAAASRHLSGVLERLGTNYLPSCLAACPISFHCRDHSRAIGDPSELGSDVRASLAGITGLERAVALADASPPAPSEMDAAAMLVRARRLIDSARTGVSA